MYKVCNSFIKFCPPPLSTRCMLKVAEQPSSSEPVELSDDIEASDDLEVGVEGKSKKDKELPLVIGKGSKAAGKKVVGLKGSGKGVEGSTNSSSVCEDVLSHFAPPVVQDSYSSMDDDLMISKMMMGAFNLAALLPNGISRFCKRMQEYEAFSKKRGEMKASMAPLMKESEGFAEKERAWVQKVDELTSRHKLEMNELKKRMETDKLQLKADREALIIQEKAFLEVKEGPKASLA
ncbi:hypothetical protein Hanom_Chr13g01212271 [Helianthus anomalus]